MDKWRRILNDITGRYLLSAEAHRDAQTGISDHQGDDHQLLQRFGLLLHDGDTLLRRQEHFLGRTSQATSSRSGCAARSCWTKRQRYLCFSGLVHHNITDRKRPLTDLNDRGWRQVLSIPYFQQNGPTNYSVGSISWLWSVFSDHEVQTLLLICKLHSFLDPLNITSRTATEWMLHSSPSQ